MKYNEENYKQKVKQLYNGELEAELKKIIKNNLYVPQNWPNKTSTECFQEDLLTIILQNINLYMI